MQSWEAFGFMIRAAFEVEPPSSCETLPGMHLLSPEPIPTEATPPFAPGEGAEVRFLGTVRGTEDGRPISGIDYSAYLPMAEKMMAALIEQGRAEHGQHEVFIQHRLGFVGAEEPSIVIRVRSRHSAEAFDLCRWYLKEVKTRVPIWKRPVFADDNGLAGGPGRDHV